MKEPMEPSSITPVPSYLFQNLVCNTPEAFTLWALPAATHKRVVEMLNIAMREAANLTDLIEPKGSGDDWTRAATDTIRAFLDNINETQAVPFDSVGFVMKVMHQVAILVKSLDDQEREAYPDVPPTPNGMTVASIAYGVTANYYQWLLDISEFGDIADKLRKLYE